MSDERLQLFVTVCDAIQHAHQKGVIHRDLKPSNVLVEIQGDRPVAKVIDFGIAKAIEQPLTDKTVVTHARQFMGTPAYMSPEQAGLSDLDIDTRTDIYSLGVLLYELLACRTPFDSKDLAEKDVEALRQTIREKDPQRPSTRLTGLGQEALRELARRRRLDPARLTSVLRRDLDWVVMKALEKDRDRRYESADAFADDVERYLRHEAVTAAAPTVGYQLRKFARRHQGVLIAASLIFLASLVGTVISLRQAHRAQTNEGIANAQSLLASEAAAAARKAELETKWLSALKSQN